MISLLVAPDWRRTPSLELPEITLRSDAEVPPMVLLEPPMITKPEPLPYPVEPEGSGPM